MTGTNGTNLRENSKGGTGILPVFQDHGLEGHATKRLKLAPFVTGTIYHGASRFRGYASIPPSVHLLPSGEYDGHSRSGREEKMKVTRMMLVLLALAAVAAAGLSVVMFRGHQNGKVTGFDRTDLALFRAQPSTSKYYTEIWFNEMQFPAEGIIVIVNLQLHNFGLKSGYGACYMTVSDPKVYEIDQGGAEPDEVKIAPSGFNIAMGTQRIWLEGNKYRVVYKGQKVSGDFTYEIMAPSYQQGDGKVVFTESGDYVMHNFPIPWAKVTGTLTYPGKTVKVSGVGSMNHDRQVLSPTRFMSDWRANWLYSPDATVSIVRASCIDLAGRWSQRLLVAEPGKLLFSSHDFKYEDLDVKPVPGSPVPCPRRFRVEAVAGDDWLKGEIRVTRIQEKKNILAEYPLVFRKIAEMVVSETWSYRYWCDYNFEFRQDGQTRTIAGTGTGNWVGSVRKDK